MKPSDSRSRSYKALIFLTGAVTLSLELLASRIMTPYFGVSLYIWSGILSITLIFLALGYRIGGRISRNSEHQTLEIFFLMAPPISAVSITISCAVYPVIFSSLSQIDLVLGSYLGALLLLAVPLVALSAMNPFLITLTRGAEATGDAGAGRVLFISTIGSVVGVLVTTFVFIPNMTNYRALLWLGVGLCVGAAVVTIGSTQLSITMRRRVIGGCALAAIPGLGLLTWQDEYLDLVASSSTAAYEFRIRGEYTSVFGNVKAVELRPRQEGLLPMFAYIQDGLIQNRVSLDGRSLSPYTYVLEYLSEMFVAEKRDALVLGLGAGFVPRNMKKRGLNVSVVEINSDALKAATEFFGFDPDGMEIHLEDARTFVRRCDSQYDVIFVDAFQGDNIPDYLLTSEFFADLESCIRPGGAVVMNAIFDDIDEEPNRHLLATVASAFRLVYEFRMPNANAFIVAKQSSDDARSDIDLDRVPDPLWGIVARTLSSGRLVTRQMLIGARPVTDARNTISVLFAPANMRDRQLLVDLIPTNILLN
ncbi:MAG: fused MFS/spermidine synthase [Alphaproteobacteria bacterium]|nr:fused MFS/spermidine synthase [Alphaproteobacteria bacterium]